MSYDVESAGKDKSEPARYGLGLSGKLLLLTIVFVMVAEVLVFVPSVSNFRRQWLMARLEDAQIAALAAEAAPGGQLPKTLRDGLHLDALQKLVAKHLGQLPARGGFGGERGDLRRSQAFHEPLAAEI